MTTTACPSYAGYRFPQEIISHAVWLYCRFPLSLRMMDELLAARGINVSHETVRQWALKVGHGFANQIRRKLHAPSDKWHLDEVALTIAGVKHWLWRAVDQNGTVLDIPVPSRRDTRAAKRLLCKLMKRQCRTPRVMITDKLASYGAARREVMPIVEHRKHKGLNNRAENSHQPTRRRERQLKRFKSAGQVGRFLSAHDGISNLFQLHRHQIPAVQYRAARTQAFQVWSEVTGVTAETQPTSRHLHHALSQHRFNKLTVPFGCGTCRDDGRVQRLVLASQSPPGPVGHRVGNRLNDPPGSGRTLVDRSHQTEARRRFVRWRRVDAAAS